MSGQHYWHLSLCILSPGFRCYITRQSSRVSGSDVHSRPLTWEDWVWLPVLRPLPPPLPPQVAPPPLPRAAGWWWWWGTITGAHQPDSGTARPAATSDTRRIHFWAASRRDIAGVILQLLCLWDILIGEWWGPLLRLLLSWCQSLLFPSWAGLGGGPARRVSSGRGDVTADIMGSGGSLHNNQTHPPFLFVKRNTSQA